MGAARVSRRALAAVLGVLLAGCGGDDRTPLFIGATTSTYDSGLLERLVQRFQEDRPDFSVRAVALASGEALELGRRGDVDVLLVHSPEAEIAFVENGHGRDRVSVMFNDFVVLGPPNDPAGVRGSATVDEALASIVRAGEPFISRGDDSGTHVRERALWAAAGIEPRGAWYRESGQGQGNSLLIASERAAYTLADRATFIAMSSVLELEVLHEGDPELINLYSIIEVTHAAHVDAGTEFAAWMTSDLGQEVIARFGLGRFGRPLFEPLLNGDKVPQADDGPDR